MTREASNVREAAIDAKEQQAMSRERGWIATTPEEVEAVWADAREVVRRERPVLLRRYYLRAIRNRRQP